MEGYTRDGLTLEESKYIRTELREVKNEDGTISFVAQKVCIDNTPPLYRYEKGKSCSRYIVKNHGIVEEWDVLDQYGDVLHTTSQLLLPKEAFIAAYNAYIKEDK